MGATFWQAFLGISLLFLQDAGVMSSRGAVAAPTVSTDDLLHLSATKEIISSGSLSSIQIEPPQLLFKNSPTCIPAISMIDILNTHESEELQILSITSDNSQFHPAIFKPQVLPPEGRATIQIIYLPRNMGSNIEGKLTIMTSFGEINYSIQASAVANPYRLHPFIGTKLPVGVVYSRPIIMYNPTDEPLHVREVFTTESFLTLHLPDDLIGSSPSPSSSGVDDLESSANSDGFGSDSLTGDYFHPQATLSSPTSSEGLWVIPPKSEKEIIHLVFHASTPGPFNGYVHVKSDIENMVLPVELHVLKGGLHPTPKSFDFGILTSPDEKRVVSISLLNSGNLPIELLDAIPSSHDPSLEISFNKGLVIPAGVVADSVVHLLYRGASPGPTQGKVIMTTNHSNSGLASVEVFYSADVLHGGVGYERNHVSFVIPVSYMNKLMAKSSNLNALVEEEALERSSNEADERLLATDGLIIRSVPFTNYFPIPLFLKSVSTASCQGVLSVGDLGQNLNDLIAPPQESWPNLALKFNVNAAIYTFDLPHTCSLTLSTNVSTHNIPVHVYDGRLKVSLHQNSKNMTCISKPMSFFSSNSKYSTSSGDIESLKISNDRASWMDEDGNCYSSSLEDSKLMEEKQKVTSSSDSGVSQKSGFHRGSVKVEFGKTGYDQTRKRLINVTNLNPVPVNVSAFMTDLLGSAVSTSSTSNKYAVSSPYSEFFYLGQHLSLDASSELVEVYEDMLSQGAIPSNTLKGINMFMMDDDDDIAQKKKSSSLPKVDVASNNYLPSSSRKQINHGKFSILPGHTAMFEVEIYSGTADSAASNNISFASLRSKTKKQRKELRKAATRSINGFILIMETPVEVIRYHMSLDVVPGNVTSYSSSATMLETDELNHIIEPIQLSSTFLEDILVCDLKSSNSEWIDLEVFKGNVSSNFVNLLHRSEACSESSAANSVVLLPGLLNKQRMKSDVSSSEHSFVEVGRASLRPNPSCFDMWACIGKWAHHIAFPYSKTTTVFDQYPSVGGDVAIEASTKPQKMEDADEDLEFLEEEENKNKLERERVNAMFASFDIINADDIRASRMVSKDLASLVLASRPYYQPTRLADEKKMVQEELEEGDESGMVSLDEHDELIKLNHQWDTFKAFGLNQIKSTVSAVTSVGVMRDIISLSAQLEAPKLHVEKSGFGITQVGEVASEYLTVSNYADKPITIQLTALANDPLVALATSSNMQKQSSSSATMVANRRKSHQPAGSDYDNGIVDSAWWNMKLKTVNNGVGATLHKNRLKERTNTPQSNSPNSLKAKSHVMNLLSASSGEIGSTCPLVDGACYNGDDANSAVVNGSQGFMKNDSLRGHMKFTNKLSLKFPKWKVDSSFLSPNETLFEMAKVALSSDQLIQPFYVSYNASRPITILPGESSSIGPIFFRPPSIGSFHSTVYLRNNFSRLEMVDLEGKAGSGEAVVRTKGGYVHKMGEIFTLKFILNTSYWQPFNESLTLRKLSSSASSSSSSSFGSSSWFIVLSKYDMTNKEESSSNGGSDGGSVNVKLYESNDRSSYSEHDHIQSILRGGSSDYYEPPIWPNPAIHIVRVENHGNLPIDITNIIVGSLVEPNKLSKKAMFGSPFENKYSNEYRQENPCVGFNSGFVVQGCEELPITLGPLQAWNVLVTYYADCSTINDVDTLQIVSSVGNFDIILQAIAKKSDMAKCEAYRNDANTTLSTLFVRLPIVFVAFLFLLFSTVSVKSMYYDIIEADDDYKEVVSSSFSTISNDISKEDYSMKSREIQDIPEDEKWIEVTSKRGNGKNKKNSASGTTTAINSLSSEVNKASAPAVVLPTPKKKNKQANQLKQEEKGGEGGESSNESQTQESISGTRKPTFEKAESGSNSKNVVTKNDTAATTSTVKDAKISSQEMSLDQSDIQMEFLVQVEGEDNEADLKKKVASHRASSKSTNVSLKGSAPHPAVESRPLTSSNLEAFDKSFETEPRLKVSYSASLKQSNATKKGLKEDTSQSLTSKVSALLPSAPSSASSVTTTSTNGLSSNTNTADLKETAKSRREKKKLEDKERKDRMGEEKQKKVDTAESKSNKRDAILKRDSDMERKEQRDRQRQAFDSQQQQQQREVLSTDKSSILKKEVTGSRVKEEPKRKLHTTGLATNKTTLKHDEDIGVGGIGIAAGWAQPPVPLPSMDMLSSSNQDNQGGSFTGPNISLNESKLDPPTFNLGVQSIGSTGTAPNNSSSFFGTNHDSSPVIGSSNHHLGLSMSTTVGSSPLRRSNIEHDMPALRLSPEPVIGHGGMVGVDSNLFSTSSGGFGSGHGLNNSFNAPGRRSLFSPERSLSQESDLNVDSFFADLSSSIAASLDLDISDPMLDPNPSGTSRLLGSIGDEDLSSSSSFSSRRLDASSGGLGTSATLEDVSLSPTMSRSRLSHYIKADSLRNSNNTATMSTIGSNNSSLNNSTSLNDGSLKGQGERVEEDSVPDYHKDAVEVDFFEQSKSFFGSTSISLLDDGLENDEDYLQGGGDEDNWE